MVLRLFPLIAYLASSAYLVCWVIRLSWAIYQRVRSWAHPPRMMLSLKTWSKVGEKNAILVYLIGMLFGGLATFWLIHIFMREWLLVIFVILAVLSDEMRVSSNETLLLEVIIFFDRLAAHNENHQDLFETLTSVIQELPEGKVQKGVLEAVHRRCSGECCENSLKAMRRIDPLLDEFVLTLQHSGGQYVPGLNIILNRLIGRAGRMWDRASWSLLLKDKSRTYVQFSRGAFVTGLWVLIINGFSNLDVVILERAVIVLAVLALLGLGVLFHLLFTNPWIRRSMAIFILIIALTSYANSLIVPIPSWIRVETISHHSESVGKTGIIAPQILTLHEEITAPFQLTAYFNDPSLAAVTNPTSMPTAMATPTMILNPLCLTTPRVIPEILDICLFHSRQSR